jgi:hypothetical protein
MADPRSVASDAIAAARDYGRESLESAKGRLADGADRMAGAAERVAANLEDEAGDNAVSELGRNVAGMIRRLAGGTRERDIEMIARELADLARRNPGVFLAGSVALGFGLARFLKARPAHAGAASSDAGYAGERSTRAGGFDADDTLDMSDSGQGRSSFTEGAQSFETADAESASTIQNDSTLGENRHEHDR